MYAQIGHIVVSRYVISTSIISNIRLSRRENQNWSLFKHRNLTSGNKILWIKGEIAPQEQLLPFDTIF